MRVSPEPLRILHAVRLLGFAGTDEIADRAGATRDAASAFLHGAERDGLLQHVAFADAAGWTLTDAGKEENERQLSDERRSADPHGVVLSVHREFRPLNARLLRAVTDWQILPGTDGRLMTNDHSDLARDARILDELELLSRALAPLIARLTAVLPRFAGYDERFAAAIFRARAGEPEWVDRTSLDSCHRVWFQLHEDLLATLGIERGDDEAESDDRAGDGAGDDRAGGEEEPRADR